MTENMTRLARTMRMLASAMLLIYGYLSLSYNFFVIGLVVLATALIGWCPIYWILKTKRDANK